MKAEPWMHKNTRFEPYDPDRAPDPSEPADPPAGMPPLTEPVGAGWNLSQSPEPTGTAPAMQDPLPLRLPLGMLVPREVPGYREAVEAGIVRLPSATEPPTPLPGVSAAWRATIVRWGPFGVLALMLVVLAPWGAMVWVFILWSAVMVSWPLAFRWCERRNLDELAAGYITMPAFERYARQGKRLAFPSWRYTGTWAFDRRGTLLWAPDLSVDAPGFYPSQNNPERLQLWTGREWLPQFSERPAPQH